MTRVKGPRVYLDYDQAELDVAYDQSVYAPNMQQIVGRYGTNSEQTRSRLGAPRRVAYGPTEIEKLDIYTTSRWTTLRVAHSSSTGRRLPTNSTGFHQPIHTSKKTRTTPLVQGHTSIGIDSDPPERFHAPPARME